MREVDSILGNTATAEHQSFLSATQGFDVVAGIPFPGHSTHVAPSYGYESCLHLTGDRLPAAVSSVGHMRLRARADPFAQDDLS